VVRALKPYADARSGPRIALFDERSGQPLDIDFRGEVDAVLDRLPKPPPRKRGRPKLGVISREISLLPRHWDWLRQQPGSASATIRRLIDQARKADPEGDARQAAIHRAYGFISDLAADLSDFEAASRALFAYDLEALQARTASWPGDVCAQLFRVLDHESTAQEN
jgi:hypothetical protein